MEKPGGYALVGRELLLEKTGDEGERKQHEGTTTHDSDRGPLSLAIHKRVSLRRSCLETQWLLPAKFTNASPVSRSCPLVALQAPGSS